MMKNQMHALPYLALLILALVGTAIAQDAKMSLTQREVVETERAFAKYAVENGQPEAWLEFFTDDGIIFKDGPVNAKEFHRKNLPTPKPLTYALNWEPRSGDVAQSGDMGYNLGPWVYIDLAKPQGPSAQGFFMTVWKKQPNGKWKEVFDFGTPVRAATPAHQLGQPFTPVRQNKSKVPSGSNATADLRDLMEKERAFVESSKIGGALNFYLKQVSDEVRVLKIGYSPAGKDAFRSYVPDGAEVSMALTPMGGEVAKSSELGYTYGSYQLLQSGGVKEKGHYTHMWKRDETGQWKIVVAGFRQSFEKQTN